ncbi:SDR family NAD(P)-dependent oxidoreductase [Chloroflexota bacterium]
MDLGLKGKTAIVTGGGSNIGRAISMTLAKEGANVVIADIDQKQMEKVVATIEASGGKAISVKTDITSYTEVEAMVNKSVSQFKNIDILVNNVGWEELHFFIETTPEFWDKIININYKGMLNCTRLVLPYMIENKSGSIVSIASDAGRMGEFRESVYGGCKAAQIALTKTVAREVGRYGIRANVACPGLTPPTPEEVGEYSMFAKPMFDQDQLDRAAKGYPLRRLGASQDLANAVAFLASDAASFITGQTLSVSGGYTMM